MPIETDVKQAVVTGPSCPTVSSLNDLGGRQVYANPLTVQYQALRQVNDRLRKAGKPPIMITPADKYLLEDDLVQIVTAGLLPATVTTISRARLWSQVLPHLSVHSDLVIARGEEIAWALRKGNPQERLGRSLSPMSAMSIEYYVANKLALGVEDSNHG